MTTKSDVADIGKNFSIKTVIHILVDIIVSWKDAALSRRNCLMLDITKPKQW